jgi:HEAT repeat protein
MIEKTLLAGIGLLMLIGFPTAWADLPNPVVTYERVDSAEALPDLASSGNGADASTQLNLAARYALSSALPQEGEEAHRQTCESAGASLDRAEASSDPAERERLLGAFRTTARRECASVFLSVLQADRALDIQGAAIEVLVALADEDIVAAIADVLGQNPDPATRRRLAIVIENIRAPSAAQHLAQLVLRNCDETLRISIPIALGRIGTPEAVKQLVNISGSLGKTDWPHIVRGFALIRDKEALGTLRELLESGAQEPVREGVALALGNYDNPEVLQAIESYMKMETSQKVREALRVSWTRLIESGKREPGY